MNNEYSGITTDNRKVFLNKIFPPDTPSDVINELKEISGKKISDLKDKEGFLIYCNEDKLKDDVEKNSVFTISDNKLTTHNIAGFIGTEHTFLTIRSRFAKDNSDDYFLHYMLQKVFNINITNLEHNTDKNKAFQFLPYLFKYYFLQALNQGLYKKYVWKKYNDSRVKGTIDIARHIKHNFIFTGNIAYNVREHSYDNNINQLIRHTIEYIDNLEMFRMMLESEDMADLVQDIRRITPTYSAKNKHQVINDNLKSDIHPYYSEYEPLRQICLQILMEDDELKYGRQENKIYGILFDVSWLWEEYLNTLIEQIDKSFTHTHNKESSGRIYMLKNKNNKPTYWHAYPDYYSTDLNIVMDAKYKHARGINNIDGDDRMQIISYMHILGVNKGVFLHPSENDDKVTCNKLHFYHKENIDECVMQYSFKIPNGEIKNMKVFQEKIKYSEEKFIKYWKTVFKQNNENKTV